MDNKKEIINVAMSTDDNYLEFLVVAVCSILANLSEKYRLSLYILNENIKAENRVKLETLKNIKDFDIEFLEVNLKPFEKLQYRGSKYINKISASRFLLPELLPTQNKCIYLDCDLIVRSDISELWNIDIEGHAFGAVEEPVCRARNIDLNIPDKFSHFNSGVLLLNLKKLREIDLNKKVCEYLDKNHELVIGDQDILNSVSWGQWYVLPMKWNMTVSMYYKKYENIFYKYDRKMIQQSLSDPAICHFTEKEKPNSFLCKHPYGRDYLKYRQMSCLPPEPLVDNKLLSYLIRFARILRKFYFFIKYIINQNCPVVFVFLRSMKRFLSGYYFKRR